MSEELKPCPFCGGSGTMRKTRDVYGTFCYAECLECGAIARGVYSMSDERAESSAAKRWNRRAERTCRNLNPPSCRDFECSECGESSEFTPGFMPSYCPSCGARVIEEES